VNAVEIWHVVLVHVVAHGASAIGARLGTDLTEVVNTCDLSEDTLLTDGCLVALESMGATVIANDESVTTHWKFDDASRRKDPTAFTFWLVLCCCKLFSIEIELPETRLDDDLQPMLNDSWLYSTVCHSEVRQSFSNNLSAR
jgi:hypothetical protein